MTHFKAIQKKYKDLMNDPSYTEEDIYEKFLLKNFLEILGYDYNNIPIPPCDIKIMCDDKQFLYLHYIKEKEIKENHIKEFTKSLYHLGGGNSEVYGILTNGTKFLLVNSKFYNMDTNNCVIFCFDILLKETQNKNKYFSYLSKKAMIDNRTVDNFKMIALFRANNISKGKVYGQYVSTLEGFFNFYAPPTSSGKPNYKTVTTDEVYKFLDKKKKAIDIDSGRKINKKTSLNNTYSHISAFYKFLLEQNEIKEIPIDTNRNRALKLYPDTQINRHTISIENNDILSMLKLLGTKRNATRNITMFALCAYFGLERSDLYNLNWDNVKEYDLQFPYIKIDEKEIPLCNFLFKKFSELRKIKNIDYNIKEKIPVFTTGKENSHRLYEAAINDIFENFKELSTNKDDKWDKMCPQLLRFSLVEALHKQGFFIDEIVYITGIDISNVGKYISNNQIIHRNIERKKEKECTLSLLEKLKKYHPYAEIFNSL